jgi:hypothetical protein
MHTTPQKIFLGIHMRFWMQPHVISFIFLGLGAPPTLASLGVWRPAGAVPAVLTALALQAGRAQPKTRGHARARACSLCMRGAWEGGEEVG